MTDNKTKLLKMVMEELDKAPPDSECQAQAAIYAVADWFDELLLTMGVIPESIPCLLRWQANQHDYLNDDEDEEERYDRDFNTEGMGDMIGPPDRTAMRKEVDDYFEIIKND